MKKVIFPGSFDPFHNGHLDIVNEALNLFDKVVITISNNPSKKNYWFNIEKRKKLVCKCIKNLNNVEVVVTGDTPIEDICHKLNIFNVIRGIKAGRTVDEEIRLKNVTDYMSNKKYKEKISFIYFLTSDADFRGSSVIKKYAGSKQILKDLIPSEIIDDVLKKYKEVI